MMSTNEQSQTSSRSEGGMMERLDKMRIICEEKIKKKDFFFVKISESKNILERKEGEKHQTILKLCATDMALADCRAASAQLSIELQNKNREQEQNSQKIEQLGEELYYGIAECEKQARRLENEKERLTVHAELIQDVFGKKRETYSMLLEENISYSTITQETSDQVNDQNSAWVLKVIEATKIQSQNAQQKLIQLEREYNQLQTATRKI